MDVHIALIRVADAELRPTEVVKVDDIPEDIWRELEKRGRASPRPRNFPFTSPQEAQ